MEEYAHTTREDHTPAKESSGKSSKRKTRAVPLVGGLAATEGSIWQRDREEPAAKHGRALAEHPEPEEPKLSRPASITSREHRTEPPETESEETERLDILTPDEARQAAMQYAERRAEELAAEIADGSADSEENAATEADKDLIDKLREKLSNDPANRPEELIDQAYAETVQPLGEPDLSVPPATHIQPHVPPAQTEGVIRYPDWQPQAAAAAAETPGADIDTIPRAEAAYYERQAENRGLLVGGIVGYLIGRRRGRLKTEKRLLPVQHNLEKQVSELHRSIADKERAVRTLAAQKARRALPISQPELSPVPSPPQPAGRVQLPDTTPAVITADVLPSRQESTVFPAPMPSKPERQTSHPEQLSEQDMVELSKKIMVDGASLHSVYEAKRITKPGLHNVVSEYIRGGNVKRILEQEMLIKELTYERDPRVRHTMSASQDQVIGAAPMLPLAAAAIQSAQASAPASLEPALVAEQTMDLPPGRSPSVPEQAIMRAWVAVIVLLAVIAVVLVLR